MHISDLPGGRIAVALGASVVTGCLVIALRSASLRPDRSPGPEASTTRAPNSAVPTPAARVGAEGADSPQTPGPLRAPVVPEERAQSCDGTVLAAPANTDASGAATRVALSHGVAISVSWLDPARGVITAGSLRDLPAWSTSKVPLSLAVVEAGQGGPPRDDLGGHPFFGQRCCRGTVADSRRR